MMFESLKCVIGYTNILIHTHGVPYRKAKLYRKFQKKD
jgi:hypothetical protein